VPSIFGALAFPTQFMYEATVYILTVHIFIFILGYMLSRKYYPKGYSTIKIILNLVSFPSETSNLIKYLKYLILCLYAILGILFYKFGFLEGNFFANL